MEDKLINILLDKLTKRKLFYEDLRDNSQGPDDDNFESGRIIGQIAELDYLIKLLSSNGKS
jgi:hypothetical protein